MDKIIALLGMIAIAAVTTIVYHQVRTDEIHLYRGLQAFEQNQMQEAANHLAHIEVATSMTPHVRLHLAEAYLATGKIEKAARTASNLLSQDIPGDIDGKMRIQSLRIVAIAFESAGRFREAAEKYTEAVELKPDDRSLRLRLARTLAWSGDFKRSAHEYKVYLKEES
jgi:predicted Zn-dependent protease